MQSTSRTKTARLVTGLLLALPALAAGPLAAAPPDPVDVRPSARDAVRVPTLPIEKVERGQTGYGLTVFAGTEPERFEVEVLGVLRNPDPRASYVLARLTGHGLEESGVVSGMSGSPVFIDGKLVGAVAFAWPFAKEAVAGITPIDAMRSIAELPSGIAQEPVPLGGSVAAGPGGGPAVDLMSLLTGELPENWLDQTLATLGPRPGQGVNGASPAIGWMTSGFGDLSVSTLARSLGAVAAGGRTDGPAGELVAGGPVAAVLVDGDLRLAATGTVTERSGSEVLAFGHPFLGLGPLSLPMASAEILTVLPSNYSSFKISNLGPVVGAFEQDSQAGIRGTLGATAPMVPYTLKIRGLREERFDMRLAAVPQLVPALVAASTMGGIDTASFSNGPQGLDLEAIFDLGAWGKLPVRQSFDGPSAAGQAVLHLAAFAGFLTGTPLERVEIAGLDVTLTQVARPRTATLVGAHAERTVVRPGETVRLNLDFKGYQGETFRRAVRVAVPEDMPAGRLVMLVGDGESADAARLALEPAEPVTFAQALTLLRSFHSKRELGVLQVFRGSGLAVAGNTLPRLPGSVRSIWQAASSGSAKPLAVAVEEVEAEELPFPALGIVRIDLEVRRRAPLVADAGGGAGPAGAGEGAEGEVVVMEGTGQEGGEPPAGESPPEDSPPGEPPPGGSGSGSGEADR
ncbi:MAG TPA: SpoIVB peptidase S55 domain-containing protein [Thermoanaerobaculia bacterium]|nr:SpoIVB peptidase S55 domain-containing protein [Thermoanaerobaculia bacterium]